MPRGGKRKGAGRKPKATISWRAVREAADAGAGETEIVRALKLPEEVLADPVVLTRLRNEIAAGHARQALELRKAIRKRGLRTSENAGSVNALSLQARNILDWDKLLPPQEMEPDLGTARQRLRDLFVKLAQARSEIEGKKVTPLQLFHREAHADQES